MIAICQTHIRKDDVRTNVNAMVKTGYRGRVIQTGDAKCPRLEKVKESDPDQIHALAGSRTDNRKIDVPKKTLHRMSCTLCGDDYVTASILSDKATRLKICSCLG